MDTLKQELISAGVMTGENVLKGTSSQITKLFDNMIFVDDTLYEHAEKIKQQFKELMIQKVLRRLKFAMEIMNSPKIV